MVFQRVWVLELKPKTSFVVLVRFVVDQIDVGGSVL